MLIYLYTLVYKSSQLSLFLVQNSRHTVKHFHQISWKKKVSQMAALNFTKYCFFILFPAWKNIKSIDYYLEQKSFRTVQCLIKKYSDWFYESSVEL